MRPPPLPCLVCRLNWSERRSSNGVGWPGLPEAGLVLLIGAVAVNRRELKCAAGVGGRKNE